MNVLAVVRYLHLLFAFLFAGGLFAAHLNTLAARRAADWAERASRFESNRRLSLFICVPALVVAGVLGQVLAMKLGYRMADTRPFQIANGVWLALLVVTLAVEMPAALRLAGGARAVARAAPPQNGTEPVEWGAVLARWSIGNGIQLVLFLVILAVMAVPWHA